MALRGGLPAAFDGVDQVVFRQDLGRPLLGELRIESTEGQVLGFVRRDGQGLQALTMNFVVSESSGQTLFRFLTPPRTHFVEVLNRYLVEDANGVGVGELQLGRGFRPTFTLQRNGRPLLTATRAAVGYPAIPVLQGSTPVAEIAYDRPYFPTPSHPGGILLRYGTPSSLFPERALLTAFAGLMCFWIQVPQWPRM